MEQWAEIRRMYFVKGFSIKGIARRTGRDRKTIRKAIRGAEPPGYRRAPVGSKLDLHREQIAALVREVDGISNTRIQDLISEAGYEGSKTILDDYLRELHPILCPKRTYQRTESKGALERTHRFMRTSFEPARSFANPLDFQDQLDRWFSERANPRFHRGIRAVPAERLIEERGRMRALPDPPTALRSATRSPAALLSL